MGHAEIGFRLSNDRDHIALTPHIETGQGIESRCSFGFARVNTESCMMPGAADGVANDKSIGQRSAVMGAGGGDSENVAALTYEDYRLAFIVADQWFIFGELAEFDARFQVRSG